MDSAALTREARQATKLTQREFGRLIGVNPITVSLWETGSRRPSKIAVSLLHIIAADAARAAALLRERPGADGKGGTRARKGPSRR